MRGVARRQRQRVTASLGSGRIGDGRQARAAAAAAAGRRRRARSLVNVKPSASSRRAIGASAARPAAAADQARRDVDEQLVDQAGGEQRCVELLAGFDVELVDAASAQVGEHRAEVDLAGRIGQQHDLGALRPRALAGARRRRPRRRRAPIRAARGCARSGGVSRRESTTTRSGWRAVATRRTSSRGSSSRTVPTPVRTAPARLRQAWPSARAASPVIHWLVPSASAVRPSSETAAFRRSQGRPRSMRETKPMLSSRDSSPPPPHSTAMPAALEPRRAAPGDERVRVAQRDDDARRRRRRRARRRTAACGRGASTARA